MKNLLLAVLLLISSSLLAQEQKRAIVPYKNLVVSRGVDVTLVKSDVMEVTIKVHGLNPDDVLVEQSNNELRIKVATKSLWQDMQDNYWWVRIEVPFDKIESLESTMGAKISSRDVINTDDIDVIVSTGAELEVSLNAKEVNVDASMGGVMEIDGTTDFLDIKASMGAEINLARLKAMNVKAKATMGANIRVYASDEFDGSATMGGVIRVDGNPEKYYESTSMGGEIDSFKSN